jgi:hypothetical protein
MAASDRVVYGRAFRPTPLSLWLAQRASGLLLGPLVLLHMASSTLAANSSLNAVLVGVIVVHGYSGLRRLAVTRARSGMTLALAVVWCGVVAVFGALLVAYH